MTPRRPSRGREFLELLAMSGIAVAEPVLTAFRDGAEVFVQRGAGALDVIAFTVIVVVGPPLALWLLLQVAGAISPSRRELVHGSLLGLLAAVVVLRAVGPGTAVPRPVVLLAASGIGLGMALARARWSAVGRWLTYLAVFPVLLGLGFVLTRPVSTLVLGGDAATIGTAAIAEPDPVVMLVLDELPTASLLGADDRIAAEQFPNLASLAEDATWYRNHSSVSPSTPQAVPAILTGRVPASTEALPVVEDHPDNLFTALGGGYRMHVDEGGTELCPTDLCGAATATGRPLNALLDDALVLWADGLATDEEDVRGDFTVRQSDPNAPITFDAWLEGVGPADGPVLDYHHALYPHQPWFHLPSGLTYEAPFVAEGLGEPAYSWTGPQAADAGRQRHLLQARHADILVGRLLERLRALDRYDDSLVVVTADHGVAFEAGEPIRGLSDGNAEQVMWTPLLVKAPGQTEGRIDERPAQTVDILPTIADHLDLELDFPTDGRSLLSEARDPAVDERVFFEWSLNQIPPAADGLVRVDGRAGYAAMLDLPPPGAGDDPQLRFWRFGRHGDLVGRSVSAIAAGRPLDGTARIEQAAALDDVTVGVSPVPVYLSGDVPGDEPVDVAVGVNGTIGGWGRSQPADDPERQHFWTMVPSQFLVDGANEIEVFVIDDGGDDAVLRPVQPAASG